MFLPDNICSEDINSPYMEAMEALKFDYNNQLVLESSRHIWLKWTEQMVCTCVSYLQPSSLTDPN